MSGRADMKQKHTPGPWNVAEDQHNDYQHAVAARNGLHVGCAYHTDPCRMTREEKANAHLIAAAPELLEALEAMRKAYGALHDGLSDMVEGGRLRQEDIPDDFKWLVKMLSKDCIAADGKTGAAIAKAKGQ